MDELCNRPRWMGTSLAATICLCVILLVPLAAHAGAPRAASRFAFSGSAILKAGASVQSGGSLRLQASFSASADSSAAAPQGGGYVLTAKLAAVPLVCTSDTIFEDGFDG